MENFSHDEIIEILSKRGGRKILYQGFSYNYKKETPNKIIWRCRTAGCNSYLQTNNELAILGISDHSHEENFEKNLQDYAYRTILKRSEETSELPREIIYRTMKDYNDVEVSTSPLLSSLTTQIKKHRNARHIINMPEKSDIPTSIRNLPSGEAFLQYDSGLDDEDRVVVFCTEENLIHFEHQETILADGTFKYVPSKFQQLFTLVAYINGIYVPLIYCLMKKKNIASYSKLCLFLKDKIPKFKPKSIILDFEAASRNVFQRMYPEAQLYGCFFHLAQILRRKIQNLKQADLNKSNFQYKMNMRLLRALCFVKVEKVELYFNILKDKINREPGKENFVEILKFFERNYINDSTENLKFWNVHERVLSFIPRTTNSLEGFHRSLVNKFPTDHPDMGFFGEKLHQEHLFNKKKLLPAIYAEPLSVENLPNPKETQLYEITNNFDALSPINFLLRISSNFKSSYYD